MHGMEQTVPDHNNNATILDYMQAENPVYCSLSEREPDISLDQVLSILSFSSFLFLSRSIFLSVCEFLYLSADGFSISLSFTGRCLQTALLPENRISFKPPYL